MSYSATLKRNREGRTNYRKRAAILISKSPFVTIKISSQNVMCQVLKPSLGGDFVISSVHSRELKNYGWKGSMNSIPACYLIGLLAAKKTLAAGIKNAILYTGNDHFTSRIAACLKGIVAAGLDVPVSKDILPEDTRITGKHISEYAGKLKADSEKYEERFSSLLKAGLKPEDYPFHCEVVRRKILEGKKGEVNLREHENEEAG
jgi:large subunit ribosomal protein L18